MGCFEKKDKCLGTRVCEKMISIWRQSLELVEEGGLKVFLNRVLEIGGEGGYIYQFLGGPRINL